MKRFHMHLNVADLSHNIRFYSQLFGVPPTVEKEDYAKWMLDDPFINFAISSRGGMPGIDHIGIQVDSDEALAALKERYDAADAASVTTETGTACCYVKSNKHWLNDPQGIAWEAYHSLKNIPTFGQGIEKTDGADGADVADGAEASGGCCAPKKAVAACCAPKAAAPQADASASASASCC
jgi:hypothetical protein